MITMEELRTKRAEDITVELAYVTNALVQTARLAIESEQEESIGGHAGVVLRLAGEFGAALIDACEIKHYEAERAVDEATLQAAE